MNLFRRTFRGFSEETFRFFRDLRQHNDRGWFEENRWRYSEFVLTPLKLLVEDLGPLMRALDPQLETRPQVNRTIARIFRDTRFSKNKALLRDHLWVVFRRHHGRLSDEVSFYFELREDRFEYGMGFYSAPRDWMQEFRRRILAHPERFLKIANHPVLRETFTLSGEKYVRPPVKEFPPELKEWMFWKSFYYHTGRPNHPAACSAALVDLLREGFLILYPMYCFIQNMKPLVNVQLS